MSQTFTDDYWPGVRSTPYYSQWYEDCDMVPTYTQHKKLLQWIGSNEPAKPWLLKYPVHMRHLKSFLHVYPDARVIWTHRDPASIISSYTSMIEVLRGLNVRPETIDRDEIQRELMEIWAPGVERAMGVREQYPEAQFYDLHFEDLVADPIAQVQKAYQQFDIDWTPEGEVALRQWSEENPQHQHGKHSHSGDQLALSKEQIQERFASYINRFDVQCT